MPYKRLKILVFYCAISAPLGAIAAAALPLSSSHKASTSPSPHAPLEPQAGNSPDNDTSSTDYDVVEAKPERPRKDIWDKLYSISGVAVALIGFYATRVYNKRQRIAEEHRKDQELILAQIQTAEKFMPHLSSKDEQIKSAALIAIDALGNRELAVKLARAFAGPGATNALTKMASSAGQTEMPSVEGALLEAFRNLTPRMVSLYKGDRRQAYGFVVSRKGLLVTTANAIDGVLDSELSVGFPDGSRVPGKRVKFDLAQDLALVEVRNQELLVPLDIKLSPHGVGDTAMAFFLSRDGSPRLRIGHVIALDVNLEPVVGRGLLRDSSDRIAVRLEIDDNGKGAAVFDGDGRLMGLVEGRNQRDVTILVPGNEVLKFANVA